MEWAMRKADPYLLVGRMPTESLSEWVDVKYECWKEGPVE